MFGTSIQHQGDVYEIYPVILTEKVKPLAVAKSVVSAINDTRMLDQKGVNTSLLPINFPHFPSQFLVGKLLAAILILKRDLIM